MLVSGSEDSMALEARRFAAIDIGSNGMRLLVVEADDHRFHRVLHSERAAVRLGHHTFQRGRLDPETADAGVAALRRFKQAMDDFGVHKVRCVATAAVREASDGRAWARRVKQELGIKVHIVDGSEEARLCHRSVRDRIPATDDAWMVMDLGGGSLELTLADHDRIHWCETRPLGTVRLLEAYDSDDHEGFVERLHEHLDRFQILRVPEKIHVDILAATGGNAGALARMVGLDPRQNAVELPLSTLRRLIEELEATTPAERRERHGFRPDRADVILPAALVYERVATLFGTDRIIIPDVGVKEGIALDLMDAAFEPQARIKRLARNVEDSAYGLGRAFRFEEDHHIQVARLSMRIFDDLVDLHGLEARDRRILKAAALLHDVGKVVSQRKHHKHSAYIIGNAEIAGLSPKATQMAAAIARYHRKSLPKPDHRIYRDLSAKDRMRVDKLAALMRIADALDKQHAQTVRDVVCAVDNEHLHLSVTGTGPFELQEWAVRKKSDLFQRVFGRSVRFIHPELKATA